MFTCPKWGQVCIPVGKTRHNAGVYSRNGKASALSLLPYMLTAQPPAPLRPWVSRFGIRYVQRDHSMAELQDHIWLLTYFSQNVEELVP